MWQVKRINNKIIELSKELSITSSGDIETYNYKDLNIFNMNIKNMLSGNFASYGDSIFNDISFYTNNNIFAAN